MEQRRAEVAGAGLAGLTVAAVLAQRGWRVRVHEQGPELREIGAGIYLFENALRVLEEIGAYDDVASCAEPILDGDLRDHADRLVIRRNERREVASRLFVAVRGDLHAALARAATAAGVEIVTDSQALAATADGRLEFRHGSGTGLIWWWGRTVSTRGCVTRSGSRRRSSTCRTAAGAT